MFVYVITNSATGKIYIGQHKGNNLKKYLQQKWSHAHHKKIGSSHLFNSMRKHPKEVWSIAPLFEGIDTKAELDRIETLLIALYNTRNPDVGYNICRGGEGYTGPFTEHMKATLRAGAQAYLDSLALVPGEVFHRLTVISLHSIRRGKKLWNCQCECGNVSQVTTSALKSGNVRSCGCLISEAATKRVGMSNLIGQTFSKLTVKEEAGRCRWSQKLWVCQCECGGSITTRTAALKSGRVKDCGCVKTSRNLKVRTEAIRLRVEENLRLTEICRALGVPLPTCHTWLKPYPLHP